MRVKTIISSVLSAAILASCITPITVSAAETLPYQNTVLSFEERAADLVSRMTLTEKAAQMGRRAPAINRLGVSAYNYWSEAIHGVARQGKATSFPVSLAMSNTWDTDLMQQAMDITSTEARGKNSRLNLSYWNPTINMARDPRWGRNEESYGEDPYLTAQFGSAAVRGMQGDDDKYLKTIATIKHFAANNNENDRQVGTSVMSERTLREYYTRAFGDITEEAKPASVMSSYNAITMSRSGEPVSDYIPSSANPYLLTDLLRRTYGFDGYVVGDCGAWSNLYGKDQMRQKLFPDMPFNDIKQEMTVAKAVEAGNNLDCGNDAYLLVKTAVEEGLIDEDTVDRAVYELFLERMRTGEFDNGAKYQDITSEVLEKDEHVAVAEQAAEESWVLLENSGALPLKSDVSRIAVVGSYANSVVLGDYSGSPTKNTTPIDGIKSEIKKLNPNAEVQYLGEIADDEPLYNVKSIRLVKADGSKKEIDISKAESVSGMTLSDGKFTNVTPKATAVIKDVDFTGVVSVEAEISTGAKIGGMLNFFYGVGGPSTASIKASATENDDTYEVCSCAYNGEGGYDGKADMYITASAMQSFSVDNYKSQLDAADYIIAYAATIPGKEGDSGESNDRESINMPAHESHVQELADAYPDKTIIAMSTVGQVNVEPFKNKCAAMLWTSYNGQAQGEALGKILTGQANPSGRLSTTWYAASDLEKMPVGATRETVNGISYRYANYELAQDEKKDFPGRTYQYYGGAAVYPFGYGKSYTEFRYSNIEVDKSTVDANETVTVTADVENTGTVKGSEVAQLYVSVPGADGKTLPLKQLKGFERVELEAGQKKTVSFALNIADVNFYDEATMKNYVVNGEYTVKVAPNADDAGLRANFTVTGTLSDALKNVTAVPTGIELIGARTGETISPANEIDACASAVLEDDTLIMDLSSLEGAEVTYTSSNQAVAAVGNDGKVTAGSAEGTALITVSVTLDGVKKTDVFPVVTTVMDSISDSDKAANIAALDQAYKSYYPLAYSAEDYAELAAIYERAKANLEKSIIAEDSNAILASALKAMAAIPQKELKIKNIKDGKITVTVPYDSAVLIEAKYSGSKLNGLRVHPVTDEGDLTLEGYEEDDKVKFMVWDSLSDMTPLLPTREHTYKVPVELNKILFNFADPAFDGFFGTDDKVELTSGELENTNGIKMYGKGGWTPTNTSLSCSYDNESYTFTRGLSAGEGSEKQRCVYFTPEVNGMVTVFFEAATGREIIAKQNDTELGRQSGLGTKTITTLEVEVTAGSPVYIYGGKQGKTIYGVMFRKEGSYTPPTPKPTEEPKPTAEPMPEIASRTKIEFEDYEKTWPEPAAKHLSTSEQAAASGGKLVDNTKNGDIIYMGARNISNLAGIEVIAGTKEASVSVEFFAVDMTGHDVTSMSQSDVDALLTTSNSIAKTDLEAGGDWNDLKTLTARVKTDKSGTMGIFMKCYTSASFCGNFDYLNLMYAAAVQTASLEQPVKMVTWSNSQIALVNEYGKNRVKQLVGDDIEVDITPDTFAQSDIEEGGDYAINDIAVIDDQLYLGCDGGILVTITPCAKCSTLKKVCDFDIKSLEYSGDELTLNGINESVTVSVASVRGRSISLETAKQMAKDGAILVDVRTAEEFASGGAVEGAINVPLSDFSEWIETQSEEDTIIVYCSSGKRAESAVLEAIELGYTMVYAVKM